MQGGRLRVELLEDRRLLAVSSLGDTLTNQFNYLEEVPPSPIDAASYLQPEAFLAFELDRPSLEASLAAAPLERGPQGWDAAIELAIPAPNGDLHRFAVVESPVMSAELAAQFPEIKTYLGRGLTDPRASLRFDLTQQGFHAQVLGPQGSFMIDPFYHLDQSVYASYWRSDLGMDTMTEQLRQLALASMSEDVIQDDVGHIDDGGLPILERTGETLRTYRLAVAATGEYTIFHGGTVTAGQSAVVTAVNRINQVYELELTVRMELVANNSSVIFTNPQTDPYTNNDGVTMLGQNQMTLDSIIGNANYDIGHVFSTGGGGVAGLGVIGITGQKARGVTGLSSPIGDPFYIDYVAHEMGHQYGGNHTFNGTGGSCSGNRASNAAYEPGSGSTIMAYAGICGNDNLQSFSDPYMHSKSLDEILARLALIPNVGIHTSTGNTPPIAVAGGNYTIPSRTPFRLVGSGTDSNPSDVLTYNWEERDLGAAQSLAQPDNGSSPLVRSWLATTNPVRTIPRMSNLLNNTTPKGEKLPQLSRTMRFRLTVRDNVAGAGGVDTSDLQYAVVDTGAAFMVTSPNTAATVWGANSTQTVTWNVAGTNAGAINTPNVNILLSTDGGQTFSIVLANDVPNDGSHEVLVPNVDTLSARIMVEGAGNVFFDLSNFNFHIEPSTIPGDFNGDSLLDCADVNALTTAIATGSTNLLYDVTADGLVNHDDLFEWIINLKQTLFGDASLDFNVDGTDLAQWNLHKFSASSEWCSGDFNADGFVDGSDYNIWSGNKFTSALQGILLERAAQDGATGHARGERDPIALLFATQQTVLGREEPCGPARPISRSAAIRLHASTWQESSPSANSIDEEALQETIFAAWMGESRVPLSCRD